VAPEGRQPQRASHTVPEGQYVPSEQQTEPLGMQPSPQTSWLLTRQVHSVWVLPHGSPTADDEPLQQIG
jgi:hypothetical protein